MPRDCSWNSRFSKFRMGFPMRRRVHVFKEVYFPSQSKLHCLKYTLSFCMTAVDHTNRNKNQHWLSRDIDDNKIGIYGGGASPGRVNFRISSVLRALLRARIHGVWYWYKCCYPYGAYPSMFGVVRKPQESSSGSRSSVVGTIAINNIHEQAPMERCCWSVGTNIRSNRSSRRAEGDRGWLQVCAHEAHNQSAELCLIFYFLLFVLLQREPS